MESGDSELLKSEAHEQAISHRLAVYLETLFTGTRELNVDCEYNKNLRASKRVDIGTIEKQALEACNCTACKKILKDPNILNDKLFRPDILVHSRGNHERNLIVVEIKHEKPCPFDQEKLEALTVPIEKGGEYGYTLGVFLWFPSGQPKCRWFCD